MTLFFIGALRALVELLGLCLLGQGLLYLLAGAGRQGNPIYRFFALVTAAPRRLMGCLLPSRLPEGMVSLLTFLLLFGLWLGLAWLRI